MLSELREQLEAKLKQQKIDYEKKIAEINNLLDQERKKMEDANGYLKQLYEGKIKELQSSLAAAQLEISKLQKELAEERENTSILRQQKIRSN